MMRVIVVAVDVGEFFHNQHDRQDRDVIGVQRSALMRC